jgi:hypothetical protein
MPPASMTSAQINPCSKQYLFHTIISNSWLTSPGKQYEPNLTLRDPPSAQASVLYKTSRSLNINSCFHSYHYMINSVTPYSEF